MGFVATLGSALVSFGLFFHGLQVRKVDGKEVVTGGFSPNTQVSFKTLVQLHSLVWQYLGSSQCDIRSKNLKSKSSRKIIGNRVSS